MQRGDSKKSQIAPLNALIIIIINQAQNGQTKLRKQAGNMTSRQLITKYGTQYLTTGVIQQQVLLLWLLNGFLHKLAEQLRLSLKSSCRAGIACWYSVELAVLPDAALCVPSSPEKNFSGKGYFSIEVNMGSDSISPNLFWMRVITEV